MEAQEGQREVNALNGTSLAVTEVATFVASVGASAFVAGVKWGKVETTLKGLSERLARIEAMFELKLRD